MQPRLSSAQAPVIYTDFPFNLTRFFQGKHLIKFLANKMHDFQDVVLHDCMFIFDAGQVYSKLHLTKLKKKEVTENPKPQTRDKNWFFENPKP